MKAVLTLLLGLGISAPALAGPPILGAGGDACIVFVNAWTATDRPETTDQQKILNRVAKAEGLAWIQGFASGAAQLSSKIAARAAKPGYSKRLLDHVINTCLAEPDRKLSSLVVEFLNLL